MTSFEFDVLGITETRIIKNKTPTSNLNINNFSFEHTPTESSAGGAMLYISNKLSYKPRNDLNIYKPLELESIFVEIINPKKSNIIIGCIYRHPIMSIENFNDFYLNPLLEKISKENKTIFLLGDFNIDLLKYDYHPPTNEFLDSLSSNYFLPHIIHPTRITTRSKTLIDNIFSNLKTDNFKAGNLTISLSDHLPQYLLANNIFSSPPNTKSKIIERNWKNFDQNLFNNDFINTNWTAILKLNLNDSNYSLEALLGKVNELLDKHAPFRKLTKQDLKFKSKPWITSGLKNSIKRKNVLFKKYIKCKDSTKKNDFHNNFKQHRNLLETLLKQSKSFYFDQYFRDNTNDLKNTWKGIRNIINLKAKGDTSPSIISHLNETITDPAKISNTFNNYFSTIGKKVQSSIPKSKNIHLI